ncbi:MAG TPA: branched-chain amino acid ABC transporter permease [Dehalococcoidales bacterium]|nr:branched-chain amino acid ABC transporter permease [Dehalococcoidales bacterium]
MMDITLIGQVLVNGILLGTMYGTAAIGLSLVFGTMRIVFIAQGSVLVFFAYLCYWLYKIFGVDPYLSIIPIVLVGLLLGVAFYYGLFKEAAALKDRIGSLLIAVGLMFALENFMTLVWTPNPRAVVTSYGFYSFTILGIHFTMNRLVGLLIAILATIGVLTFLKKTMIGTAVRAISEDSEASTMLGINPDRVNAVAFAIGIGLAAIAGVNVASPYSFDPVYGIDVAIKALFALTLGGVGTVHGALLGGIIIGLVEMLGTYFVGAGWAQAILFAVFLVALTFRPSGLFGGTSQKS